MTEEDTNQRLRHPNVELMAELAKTFRLPDSRGDPDDVGVLLQIILRALKSKDSQVRVTNKGQWRVTWSRLEGARMACVNLRKILDRHHD